MKLVLLLAYVVAQAAAFAPVVPAAKKKGVNPALFATGIVKKEKPRGLGRKPFRNEVPGQLKAGAAAGMITPPKPWLEASKKANAKVSPFLALSAALGGKTRPGGGAGIFDLSGGRTRKK